MIDLALLRSNRKRVEKKLNERGYEDVDLDRILETDTEIREKTTQLEELRAEKNKASKRIPQLSPEEREVALKELKRVDERADALTADLSKLQEQQQQTLAAVPNLHLDDVPVGDSEQTNKIVHAWGDTNSLSSGGKDYLALATDLDLIDTKRPAQASGSRFGALRREAVQLEFALVQHALRTLTAPEHGFIPLVPPVMIREQSMWGMGFLDRDSAEVYHLEKDNLALVGTSEQSVVPLHANDTFAPADLPLRYVAFSTCFRREAGSYGKDTKGIFRVHQFDKVEMVAFTTPERAEDEQAFLLDRQKELIESLGIPYRIAMLSTGEMGFQAARTYDIESWIPSEQRYRETHSCSTCTDFQSRRLNIRFKGPEGNGLVHTLNGTAFAIGRTLIAILEHYQQSDGSIKIPDALQPYLPFDRISRANE